MLGHSAPLGGEALLKSLGSALSRGSERVGPCTLLREHVGRLVLRSAVIPCTGQ